MAIITFWSNDNIETGQTMSMAAIATHFALKHNYKILMINTAFNDYAIEDGFWMSNRRKILKAKQDIATGLNGLTRAINSNQSSPNMITNYTKIIFKNRLELLTDSEISYQDFEKQKQSMKDIIKLANNYYDYIFIDLKGSINDEYIKEILSISNIVVVNITQRLRNINGFLELKEKEELLKKDNIIVMIGNYNPRSAKYTARNIARYLKVKEILNIPFNNSFFEVSNEGEIADFFIKFRKIKEINPNAVFFQSVDKITTKIIEKIQQLQMKI